MLKGEALSATPHAAPAVRVAEGGARGETADDQTEGEFERTGVDQATLQAPRRAATERLPHQQREIERPGVNEQTFGECSRGPADASGPRRCHTRGRTSARRTDHDGASTDGLARRSRAGDCRTPGPVPRAPSPSSAARDPAPRCSCGRSTRADRSASDCWDSRGRPRSRPTPSARPRPPTRFRSARRP